MSPSLKTSVGTSVGTGDEGCCAATYFAQSAFELGKHPVRRVRIVRPVRRVRTAENRCRGSTTEKKMIASGDTGRACST